MDEYLESIEPDDGVTLIRSVLAFGASALIGGIAGAILIGIAAAIVSCAPLPHPLPPLPPPSCDLCPTARADGGGQ